MTIDFSADRVFETAKRIEDNAAEFYRHIVRLFPEKKALFSRLAAMEDDHRRVFERMQSELGDAGRDAGHASREDCGAYLSAVADLHGGEGSPSVAASLTGSESIEEILRLAISLEKKSILFYMGMEELFLRKSGGKEIAAVIDEEKSHIVILSKELYGCGSRQNG